MIRPKPPVDNMSAATTTVSVTGTPTSRPESVSGHTNVHTPEFFNLFATSPTPGGPMRIVTKSSFATAAMGYNRKASV